MTALAIAAEFEIDEPCTARLHESMKRDRITWQLTTTKRGLQHMDDGEVLEFRNCRRCHSTLAVQLVAPRGADK